MIDLEELHRALAKLREKYIDDVTEIATFMLHRRSEQRYSSAEHAEEDLDYHVQKTFWAEQNHGCIVLYLSENRDIADHCLGARDVDRDDFIAQRAMLAMTADVCKFLWGRGWTSIGEQYRNYTVEPVLNVAIKKVVEHGLKVCDQLEATKSVNSDTEESRLLRAIQELQLISSK
jgi:hypothetical protein